MDADTLKAEVRELILEIAELAALDDDKPLRELGVDSMVALEIITAIERKYGIKVEESELTQIRTLSSITALLHGKLAARG